MTAFKHNSWEVEAGESGGAGGARGTGVQGQAGLETLSKKEEERVFNNYFLNDH